MASSEEATDQLNILEAGIKIAIYEIEPRKRQLERA